MMDGYWRDDLSQEKRAAILADWCDELEDWPLNSIQAAFRKHRSDRPDKKPNPGHILQLLNKAWGQRNAPVVRAALEARQNARPQPMTREQHEKVSADLADLLRPFIRRVDPPREF